MREYADLVFRNGPVFRADAARSWAAAVAVRAGRIVAVGGDRDVADHTGPATEVIDLAGRLLTPGFQDAHVHPRTGGRTLLTCNLTEVLTLDAAIPVIREYAAGHRNDPWVWGGGWQFAWFPAGMPTKELLDDLVPDRPAYLRVADGHAGWANSMALAAAGIDRDTPDPAGGRIERNPDGSLQGTLQEDGAMNLVESLQVETPEMIDRSLLRGQDHLLSVGITAWQDAWVEPELHASYVRLAASGELVASVRGALWWDASSPIATQIERIEQQRSESIGRYTAGSVKLMLDGVVENFTARMIDPYLDGVGRSTGNTGMDFVDPAELPGILIEIVRHGFQPHFHALGDAAVRSALDAVEAARDAVGLADVRPHIAHIQVVDPSDIPRFRRLGVTANAQALWACHEDAMRDLTLPFLTERAAAHQYPFASLLQAGAALAMGSDWSVSTPDVMEQIDVATTRRVPWDRSRVPFQPEQRITVADALAGFTAGSSFVNHLDDRGSIEVGRVADLAVVGGNPFESDDIAALPIDLTVVSGEVVFERT
jgi:hypothetical protein